MGLKKYEIITVGSDKRVRALRSWQVGDRYVNIGDVGGIVYDEKTLSQDGLCWLFRGNFGFPGARIGGDSIVDVAEAELSTAGAPNVDILGSSVVVGSKLQFESELTTADAIVLTAADFEQGAFVSAMGMNWETWRRESSSNIRSKAPIFMGGKSVTLKVAAPGYTIHAYVLDRDGMGLTATSALETGAGVTLSVPAGQYFVLRLTKNPMATITPADATAAQITFTGTYETKLSIVDSRVEINPATSTGTATIKPGGFYIMSPGAKYPDGVIRNSKVVINGHATANRVVRLISEFIGCNVTIDATTTGSQGVGVYSNVKNLTFTGLPVATGGVAAHSIIQATDCDNFAVSPAIFPGLAAAQTANMPFIFQGCNVPNGLFYHHAQIANTYKNIDFAKAIVDLGKVLPNANISLVSSEIEGMYRLYSSITEVGALVESHDSVKFMNMTSSGIPNSYGTTIYKDAYLSGLFDFAGTNVFGNKVRSHPLAQVLNVQPRAVQGSFNAVAIGETITGANIGPTRVRSNTFFRLNRAEGLKVSGMPSGIQCIAITTDVNNKIITLAPGWTFGELTVANNNDRCYLMFRKPDDSPITPEELTGVTVTVYNGCKIVNTGATAVNMKGNIRVEDNATLVNASVTGTGYFGGNSVVYRGSAALEFNGTVHMKDNAVFAPASLSGSCTLVHMQDNAKFIGSVIAPSTNLSFIMAHNAIIEGISNTRSGVVMYGNTRVTPTGIIEVASRGALVMEENASIEASTTVIGAITLAGNYKGDVKKTWVGKRTITDVNAPEYDNNVKSKYDL